MAHFMQQNDKQVDRTRGCCVIETVIKMGAGAKATRIDAAVERRIDVGIGAEVSAGSLVRQCCVIDSVGILGIGKVPM